MAKASRNKDVRFDLASFRQEAEVKSVEGQGRSLFAKEYIQQGDVVLVEKAFCVAFKEETRMSGCFSFIINVNTKRGQVGAQAALLVNLVVKLRHNPVQAGQYLDLYDGGHFDSKEAKLLENGMVIDTFQV
ncbi:hypothetical protein DFJ77DRAFT_217011 [Powellomyces hirtus]|nr:hypothetical protein DFJ77DRAFT_217011 [Powellomyces hirtus]